MDIINKTIKESLEKNGVSIRQLAKDTTTDYSNMKSIVAGRRNPPYKTLLSIIHVLQIELKP